MFVALRDVLAGLYRDEASARRMVDEAGLDSALISFSARAKDNWHEILSEAEKQGKVDDLLGVARREYPENPGLCSAWEAYRKLVERGGRLSPPVQMAANDEAPESSGTSIPKWFSFAGVAFGALTLLFFMALVIASLFAYEVPANSRFLVVVVLALGSALSTSFIGGWAAAKGYIPLPFVEAHPVEFSVGGGIAVLLILVLLGYWVYVRGAEPPAPPSLPSVLLMDSKEPEQIYDPEGQGTNTDEIRDILRWLPIRPPMEEVVYYEWDDAEVIAQSEPDLVIIHGSAFYTSTVEVDYAKKLETFLRAMQDTHTRFLVYSRRSSFEDEEVAKQAYENAFPFLEGRVDVLWVPKTDYCSYWECSETREKLRRKVKSLLGLP